MKQIVPAVAGTLESSDALIRIEPLAPELPPEIEITSSVQKQFGDAIRATLIAVLQQHGFAASPSSLMTKVRWTACCAHDWKPL